MAKSPQRPFGHEPAGIAARPILWVAAILAVTVVSIALALHWSLQLHDAPDEAQSAARRGLIPPEPRLQAHATADLAAMREQQIDLLAHYGWLDAAHTVARVPIQRAMAIYARQHAQPDARSDGTAASEDLPR